MKPAHGLPRAPQAQSLAAEPEETDPGQMGSAISHSERSSAGPGPVARELPVLHRRVQTRPSAHVRQLGQVDVRKRKSTVATHKH